MALQYTDPYDLVVVGAGMAGLTAAARIARAGVNPRTGGRLRVALIERGPYLEGEPRPGYGHPLRRRMFTNIMSEFRERNRYRMGVYPEGPGWPQHFCHSGGFPGRRRIASLWGQHPGILTPSIIRLGSRRRVLIGPKPTSRHRPGRLWRCSTSTIVPRSCSPSLIGISVRPEESWDSR